MSVNAGITEIITTEEMGSAAVLYKSSNITRETKPIVSIITKSTPQTASSTKAELSAIASILMNCKIGQKVVIHTDSQATIDITETLRDNTIQDRQRLKLANNTTAITVGTLIKNRDVEIVKVKAHQKIKGNESEGQLSKILGNQAADELADEAAKSDCKPVLYHIPDEDENTEVRNTYLFCDGTLQETYPATYIKTDMQKKFRAESMQLLNKTFVKYFGNDPVYQNVIIDYQKTKLLSQAKSVNNGKYLDTTNMYQLKFRQSLLIDKLPLNYRMKRINMNDSDECPYCEETETTQHFFTCLNTLSKLPEIYEATISKVKERFTTEENGRWSEINIPQLSRFNISPIKFGFITITDLSSMKDEIICKGFKKTLAGRIAENIIDEWLTQFYLTIWIPRSVKSKEQIQEMKKKKRRETRSDTSKSHTKSKRTITKENSQNSIRPQATSHRVLQNTLATPSQQHIPQTPTKFDSSYSHNIHFVTPRQGRHPIRSIVTQKYPSEVYSPFHFRPPDKFHATNRTNRRNSTQQQPDSPSNIFNTFNLFLGSGLQ